MRSQGTKETQGINGDARNLSKWLAAAPASSSAALSEPCPYPHHRPADWITPKTVLTCGVCHPPAVEFAGVRRRDEDGFAALVASRRVVIRGDRHVDAAGPRTEPLELDAQELAATFPSAVRTLEAQALEVERDEEALDAELDAALEGDA